MMLSINHVLCFLAQLLEDGWTQCVAIKPDQIFENPTKAVSPIGFVEDLPKPWQFSQQSQRGSGDFKHDGLATGGHRDGCVAFDTCQYGHLTETRARLKLTDLFLNEIFVAHVDIQYAGDRNVESVTSPIPLAHDFFIRFVSQKADVWSNLFSVAVVSSDCDNFKVAGIFRLPIFFFEEFGSE